MKKTKNNIEKFAKSALAIAAVLLVAASLVFAGSWSGNVIDQATSLPIFGANVTAVNPGTGLIDNFTLTDATGFFNITGLGNSSGIHYILNASAPGYLPLSFTTRSLNTTRDRFFGTFTLTQSIPSNITGTVMNSTIPLNAATINVYNVNTGALVATAPTDASGNYNVSNLLSPAFYNINVTAPFHEDGGLTGVYLDSNTTLQQNFTLVYIPGTGNITGTATNISGSAVSGATIKVYNFAGGALAGSGTTDTNGNYAITNIASGTYYVNLTKTNYVVTSIGPIGVLEYQNTTVDFNGVSPTNATSIVVSRSGTASLQVGQTRVFTVTGYDQYGDPVGIDASQVVWSVSGSAGAVSPASGSLTTTFTGRAVGSATVIATYNNSLTASASPVSVTSNGGGGSSGGSTEVSGGPGSYYPPAVTPPVVTPPAENNTPTENVTPPVTPPVQTNEVTVTTPTTGLVANTPLTFTILHTDGTPVSGANVQFYTPTGSQVTLPTDAQGNVVFTPTAAGVYSYNVPNFIGQSTGTFSVSAAPSTGTTTPNNGTTKPPVLVPANQTPTTVPAPAALVSPVDSIVNSIKNNLAIIAGGIVAIGFIGAIGYTYFVKGGMGGYHGGSSSLKAVRKELDSIPEVKYSSQKEPKYKPLGKTDKP